LGELPWHLAEAHEFDRLYSLLEDLTFSMAIFQANPVDLKRYWALIEANTNRRMLEAYQGPLSDPNRYAYNDLWSLAVLLDETGHIQEAYNIRKYLYPRTNDPIRRGSLLDFQAETLFNQNRLDEALKLVEEEAAIGQSASSQIHVEASLVEKGKILHIQKRYDEALSVFEKALQISDQISHLHGRMLILGFKALTRRDQGFLDEAMQLHKEQETLARQLNEPESVRSCLINQAVVLSMMNRLPEALAIWEEQLLATRQRGEAVEEAICLSNMAWALNKLGKVNEALPVAEEAYALAKNRNLSRLLSEIEPTLNDIRRAINPPDEDFLYPGYPPQPENPALNSTFAEAWALAQKDNIEQAVALLNKTEQTCFLAGDVAGAVFSAMNRASLLARAAFRRANDGDIPAATTLLDAGEKIFRTRIDYQQGLAAYITGKALLLVRLGKLVDAKWQLSDARHLLAGLEPDESTERIKAILDKISSQLSTLTG
jgi:tetratricopeptide (TPR) repeat protein